MRKKGSFIRGRRFLEVGRLFKAIRYIIFEVQNKLQEIQWNLPKADADTSLRRTDKVGPAGQFLKETLIGKPL